MLECLYYADSAAPLTALCGRGCGGPYPPRLISPRDAGALALLCVRCNLGQARGAARSARPLGWGEGCTACMHG
jgi:hypothetical protein